MFRVGIKFPYHGLPRVCMIFVKDHIVICVKYDYSICWCQCCRLRQLLSWLRKYFVQYQVLYSELTH